MAKRSGAGRRARRAAGDGASTGRKDRSTGLASGTWSIGRKLAYGYAAAGIVLLAVLAVRAPTAKIWFWSALLVLMGLVLSLRSALVWCYRRNPSHLNWWLQPGLSETDFNVTYLFYAVVGAASSVLVLFM